MGGGVAGPRAWLRGLAQDECRPAEDRRPELPRLVSFSWNLELSLSFRCRIVVAPPRFDDVGSTSRDRERPPAGPRHGDVLAMAGVSQGDWIVTHLQNEFSELRMITSLQLPQNMTAGCVGKPQPCNVRWILAKRLHVNGDRRAVLGYAERRTMTREDEQRRNQHKTADQQKPQEASPIACVRIISSMSRVDIRSPFRQRISQRSPCVDRIGLRCVPKFHRYVASPRGEGIGALRQHRKTHRFRYRLPMASLCKAGRQARFATLCGHRQFGSPSCRLRSR